MRRILLFACLGLVALTACEGQAVVRVEADEDGSGTVVLLVGLDAEALARIGGLDNLKFEDLASGGWELDSPQLLESGWIWLRATKPFGTRSELPQILDQIAGSEGPLQGVSLSVDDGFAQETHRFSARLKSSGSLDVFSDGEVAAALDGLPLGRTPEELQAELAGASKPFSLRLEVLLPEPEGSKLKAGPTIGGLEMEPTSGAWDIDLAKPVDRAVSAESEQRSAVPSVALKAGITLLLLSLVVGLVGVRGASVSKRTLESLAGR